MYFIFLKIRLSLFVFFSQEEMNGDEEGDPDEGGGNRVISWGCGEFGQHCHGCKEDVAFSIGLLKENLPGQVKFVACGASHTILVNGKCQSWELSLLCQKGERERGRDRERERERENI